jgi:hypothetical protein
MPKPMHGWRVFAGEIAIIVIGVLLALGAQSIVEQWRWQGEVKTSNDAFRDELGTASAIAYERLIIQPCLQGRISELSRLLAEKGSEWAAQPMTYKTKSYFNVMPVAYAAPSRLLPTDAWKNAISNGTLNHLSLNRVRELSNLYGQVADFDALQDDEAKAAARLTPLVFNRTLDTASRTDMLASLAEVDRINGLMGLQATQIIDAVRELRLGFPKSEVEVGRNATVKAQRAVRGACVANLPFDAG